MEVFDLKISRTATRGVLTNQKYRRSDGQDDQPDEWHGGVIHGAGV